jgi:hypothetical protein
MGSTLNSNPECGTFSCLLSRLLLWLVVDPVDGNETYSSVVYQQLPSWSWMRYSHIKFFPIERIKVPKGDTIRFSSDLTLLAQIRRLQNCNIKQEGDEHVIKDNDIRKVGELWFDGLDSTAAEECAVVGIQEPDDSVILLVSKQDKNHYQRVGAGVYQSSLPL